VPSKRACFEVFACEAGILLARGGTQKGPHSTSNFTAISLRKKVICLTFYIGSDNSTFLFDSRREGLAGAPHFVIFKSVGGLDSASTGNAGDRAENPNPSKNRKDEARTKINKNIASCRFFMKPFCLRSEMRI
jgi:hypothetical protein